MIFSRLLHLLHAVSLWYIQWTNRSNEKKKKSNDQKPVHITIIWKMQWNFFFLLLRYWPFYKPTHHTREQLQKERKKKRSLPYTKIAGCKLVNPALYELNRFFLWMQTDARSLATIATKHQVNVTPALIDSLLFVSLVCFFFFRRLLSAVRCQCICVIRVFFFFSFYSTSKNVQRKMDESLARMKLFVNRAIE